MQKIERKMCVSRSVPAARFFHFDWCPTRCLLASCGGYWDDVSKTHSEREVGKSDGSDLSDLSDGSDDGAGLKIWYNGNGFSGRAGISGEGGWVRLV